MLLSPALNVLVLGHLELCLWGEMTCSDILGGQNVPTEILER